MVNRTEPTDMLPYVDWLDEVWERKLTDENRAKVQLTVGILLWPTFPLMSLSGIIESLRHAGDAADNSRQRYVRWEVVGSPGRSVTSSCGISVAETSPYVHPGDFDYLFVIGGLLKDLEDGPNEHSRYLHVAKRTHCTIVGVCTGSFILAQEKLLSKAPAAIHPYHKSDFEAAFPGHRFITDADFSTDGRVITIPGGTSILSYMTEIINSHFGPDRAAKTVHQLSLTAKREMGTLERVAIKHHVEIDDPRIQKALVMIDANLEGELSIGKLSSHLGMSERHFLRQFRAEVGTAPQNYIIEARLKAAIWMLQNSQRTITSIAYASGFTSGASLSEACRRRLGKTPSQIRKEV